MRKILTSAAISFLGLLLATGTAYASTTISGNGSSSHTSVVTSNSTFSFTSQTNVATIVNGIVTGSKKTGGNTANNNTGGSVTVTGGSTTNVLGINNITGSNSNTSTSSCCPCNLGSGDVTVTGNGSSSSNSVVVATSCTTKLSQTNVSNISNTIYVGGSTGGNKANGNTGGDVSVTSGDSTSSVTVTNVAGSNTSM